MIEVVGSSTKGTDDAIEQAIAKAGESLHNLDWFEVSETRGHIVNGKVAHYQVSVKIGFRLD
jgi:flavin-binding protein dodecin